MSDRKVSPADSGKVNLASKVEGYPGWMDWIVNECPTRLEGFAAAAADADSGNREAAEYLQLKFGVGKPRKASRGRGRGRVFDYPGSCGCEDYPCCGHV